MSHRTLHGDRYFEHGWILHHFQSEEVALDFGCGSGPLTAQLASRCKQLVAIDLLPTTQPTLPNLIVIQADVLHTEFPHNRFDVIVNCSTIEHVGISGRYGIARDELDADLQVMKVFREILKPSGRMLLALPVGQDRLVAPYHRIYGERLRQLLRGWEILASAFFIKTDTDNYKLTACARALRDLPTEHYYALGLFVLRISRGNSDAIHQLHSCFPE